MKKRGQFYFLAIVLLAAVLISFVTISNVAIKDDTPKVFYQEDEINTEVGFLFDYFSANSVPDETQTTSLTNFSNLYIDKIGDDKNVFFVFGKGSELNVVGNRINGTEFIVETNSENYDVTDVGKFENTYSLSGSEFNVSVDGIEYPFQYFEGQNFYYLIKYIYNDQTFVIVG